jgi:hypothetical protein
VGGCCGGQAAGAAAKREHQPGQAEPERRRLCDHPPACCLPACLLAAEKGTFLGLESAFEGTENGYPGGIFDPMGMARCGALALDYAAHCGVPQRSKACTRAPARASIAPAHCLRALLALTFSAPACPPSAPTGSPPPRPPT